VSGGITYYGEVIALLTTLSWSIGIFPFTEASRRLGPNSVNHFRLILAVLFLSIITICALPVGLPGLFTGPLPEHWLWFGLSGVIGLALGDHFAFTAFAILGPRITSIFSTLAPAAALCTGYYIIGERINLPGVIGIVITISGVIWLTMSKKEQSQIPKSVHGNIRTGILYGILSAACQGVGLVLANKGFTYKLDGAELPFFQATWLRMFCATVVIFALTALRGKLRSVMQPVIINKEKGNWYALAGTIFGPVIGVSLSMYSVSLLKDKPSVAQTIFSLMPIVALPLAVLIYKEKVNARAIAGALIAIAGVVILIWREEIAALIN
jgi:drug/metabolite transporter (DMT)-like permease